MRLCLMLALANVVAGLSSTSTAQTPPARIGIVIMHGKGGSPASHVSDLAASLQEKGYLVANLEMPWSGRRSYDASVAVANQEVESALETLRSKGALKLFVAGHSQGAVFALYFGGKHVVDGIIAIAPGGNVANTRIRETLSGPVKDARKLVAENKGEEKTGLFDYGGGTAAFPIFTAPAIYLTWFDPAGAMNQFKAVKAMNPQTPVLFITATGDLPGGLQSKQRMFDSLPKNPLNKLYEPETDHAGAPSASREEIVRWITDVVNKR